MIHHLGIMLASTGLGMPNLTLGVLVGLVVLGLAILAFTSYRYVIGYFVAGMVYWGMIEGLHWIITAMMSLTDTHAYVAAIALSLIPLWGLLAYQPRTQQPQNISNTPHRLKAGQRPFILERDTDFYQHCVRHIPVIDNEH